VPIQAGVVASIGDGVEVEREGFGLGEEETGQGTDPASEEGPLVVPAGAVGVGGRIGLFRQDVEAGEQAQGLVEVEVIDIAAPLLVEELQRQQTQQGQGAGIIWEAGYPA
jgi:hypothetical protein